MRIEVPTGKRHVSFLIIVSALLILQGCASLSEKECMTANWYEQGYRDGRNGQPASRIEDHREACFKVGVVPDPAQYAKGRAGGVLEYCTPENALREGRNGKPYRNACPVHLEGQFLNYHQAGYRVYQAVEHVNYLNRQSQQLERKLDKEKDDKKRRRIREELRDLDRNLRRAHDHVFDAERRLQY